MTIVPVISSSCSNIGQEEKIYMRKSPCRGEPKRPPAVHSKDHRSRAKRSRRLSINLLQKTMACIQLFSLQTDKMRFWMREWALSTEELKLDIRSFMDMGRSYVYINRTNESEINVFIFWVRESNTHRSFLAKELYVGFQQMDAQWSHRRPARRH